MTAAALAALVLALSVIATAALGDGRQERDLQPVPPPGSAAVDGRIYDLTSNAGRIYARGQFREIGAFNGSSVGIDPVTGAQLSGFPVTDGQVSDVIDDGSGGWYIAGSFDAVDGLLQPTVAHVEADGSLDQGFAPPLIEGDADALALVGDTLFLGGAIRTDGRDTNLLALDAGDGSLTDPVTHIRPRVTELAYAPAAPGRTARLIVGTGLPAGPSGITGVYAIDPVLGGPVPGFTPPTGGNVRALAVSDDTLYVGGRGLAALDLTTGARIPTFDAGTDDVFGETPKGGLVHVLALDGDRLLAGGNFSALGGRAGAVVALDPDTGLADPSFRSPLRARRGGEVPDSGVFDLALTPGRLWVGGDLAGPDFARGGQALVPLDPETGAAAGSEALRLNDQVNALAYAGGRLYAGGWFFLTDPHAAKNLASLDSATLAVTDEVHGLPRSATARSYGSSMLPANDRLIFSYTNFHGYEKDPDHPWVSRTLDVAGLDTSNGRSLSGHAIGKVKNLTGIAVAGDRAFVAQRLSNDVRFPRNRISVRSVRTGKQIDSFELPLRGYVTTLEVSGGSLYAAGSFRRFRRDGSPAHLAVIKVDQRDGSLQPSFDPHVNGPVYDIDISADRVYMNGLFKKAGSRIPRRHKPGFVRVPIDRSGLNAADSSSGRPVRSFAPTHDYRFDLFRVNVIGSCVAIGRSTALSTGSLLSQQTGKRCPEGVLSSATAVTPVVGRVAYVGLDYGVANPPRFGHQLSYISLTDLP